MIDDMIFFRSHSKIFLGQNISRSICDLLSELGINKVFIVSDHGLMKVGVVGSITKELDNEKIIYDIFLDLETNPTTDSVYSGLERFRKDDYEILLAIGGGSAMDVAKSISVLAKNGKVLNDYEGHSELIKDAYPIIAIPTTAGTGSEVTMSSVIVDKKQNYKMVLKSELIVPQYVFLDPSLLSGLPLKAASDSAMDALVHAMESYVSVRANAYTDALNEKAISLIGHNIKEFINDRSNIDAATNMLVASNLAGMAFAITSLGLVHAMSHPISAIYNVPHGLANAILLNSVIKYNYENCSDKYRKIYTCLSGRDISKKLFTIELLLKEISNLNKDFHIAEKLSELGLDDTYIDKLSNDALISANCITNPKKPTKKDIINMYLSQLR